MSSYTANRGQLLARLGEIKPTSALTSLLEALQVAAGLANPSRQYGEGVNAASVEPPKLSIFTDGGFGDVAGFSLGNLNPEFVQIGPPPATEDARKDESADKSKTDDIPSSPPSDNVAILAFRRLGTKRRPIPIRCSAACATIAARK